MRKKTMKMMVIAGAVAMLLPSAAMAEWDQTELRNNQDDHDAMINVYTNSHSLGDINGYGMESTIGYDDDGKNMTAAQLSGTDGAYKKSQQAPWNTTPCPIQLADTTAMYMWDDAMGNCPAQKQPSGWTIGQTDKGWKEGDNELYGVILDDLYQSMSETSSTTSNENGEPAWKKVTQVLDILYYRSNTEGEVFGSEGWTDANSVHWYGGLGIDQTLDQDVADFEGTNVAPADGTAAWALDHMAQTFYQDFRLFDKYNTFGGVGDVDGNEEINYKSGSTAGDYVNLATADKTTKGLHNPRTRHGMELLNWRQVSGDTSYDTSDPETGPGWGVMSLDVEDFAFFDQWVIQSLRDTVGTAYGDATAYTYNQSSPNGTITWTGNQELNQSYSSWMSQGLPGEVCEEANSASNTGNTCKYDYKKDAHHVDKTIADNGSTHEVGLIDK